MNRRWLAITCSVACLASSGMLLAVTGCRSRDDAQSQGHTQAALPKIKVDLQPYLSWGPIMIAQAEGYFHDEGLDVEFVTGLRSEESLVALVSGAVDVRPGPVSTGLLSAIEQGAPIRLASGMGYLDANGCTYFGIVLRHGLDDAHRNDIKRMRVSQDGTSRYLVQQMLAARNVPLARIETVRLPEPAMVSAIQSGTLDAAANSEPTLSRLAQVGTMWLSAEKMVPDFQWGVIAFGKRIVTKDRDLGARFLRGYRRGLAKYREGKSDRNVAILAEGTGHTVEDTKSSCWPSFQDDFTVNWQSITAFQQWAVTEKLLDRVLPEAQVLDPAFGVAAAATGTTPAVKPSATPAATPVAKDTGTSR